MLKKLFYSTVFYFCLFYSPAQQFEWTIQTGGWSLWNEGRYIMNDTLEKVYVQGTYEHYLEGYPYGAFSSKFDESGTGVFYCQNGQL